MEAGSDNFVSSILTTLLTKGFYTIAPSIGSCEKQYTKIHRVFPEHVCFLPKKYYGFPLKDVAFKMDICIAEVTFDDDILYVTRLRDYGITWSFNEKDLIEKKEEESGQK